VRVSSGLRSGALGQFLAYPAHWHAGLAGRGADIDDRRPQGVLPEVVGLPPGDLTEQVGLCPATQRRHCQDSELKLLVFPAAEGALWREPLPTSLPGPAGRRGWPRTTPARRRRPEGGPRRGRCCRADATALARLPTRIPRCPGPSRRAGSGGRWPRPGGWAASWQAYPDGRAEPARPLLPGR